MAIMPNLKALEDQTGRLPDEFREWLLSDPKDLKGLSFLDEARGIDIEFVRTLGLSPGPSSILEWFDVIEQEGGRGLVPFVFDTANVMTCINQRGEVIRPWGDYDEFHILSPSFSASSDR